MFVKAGELFKDGEVDVVTIDESEHQLTDTANDLQTIAYTSTYSLWTILQLLK